MPTERDIASNERDTATIRDTIISSDILQDREITMQMLFQGAESKIYYSKETGTILKRRLKKSYRIKELDDKLIKQRTRREEKVLKKLNGILQVPKVFKVVNNDIYMEFIDGLSVKDLLGLGLRDPNQDLDHQSLESLELPLVGKDKNKPSAPSIGKEENKPSVDIKNLATDIGKGIANMHDLNIVHGDLTTSNMIYKSGIIYWIDFGLSCQSTNIEEKAVDLYVLERGFQVI
jgi:TP53 regulating kinase and related kinases